MNEYVTRLVERVDELTVTQRALIFAAAALLMIVAAYAAFLKPLRVKDRQLTDEVAQQRQEMATLQTQLQRFNALGTVDPDAANRARLASVREELRQLNARIVERQRSFTPPEQMRQVLEDLLARNRGLALVDLRTLPVVPIAPQRSGSSSGGMYRHSIELTVRGSYGELYEYLRALEKLPNQLYWGRAELAVQEHPVLTLKLTMHTLSFDRAWLIV